MAERLRIVEVGPRDGLQNEARPVPVPARLALIAALARAGLTEIEIGAFVSPRWVPQMAATPEVLAGVAAGPVYHVLVPNMAGWERFAAARVPGQRYVAAVFVAASEGFSRANLNCSVAESLERVAPVVAAARAAGVPVRGYVSCVTDCPFDGPVPPGDVARVVAAFRGLAGMEVSLGDTIGRGRPETVAAMLEAVAQVCPVAELAGHFHDTGGRALENVAVAVDAGLRSFDAAVGGLGGCPYAPGAPGNLATEALAGWAAAQGYDTGVDAGLLALAAEMAQAMRGADGDA